MKGASATTTDSSGDGELESSISSYLSEQMRIDESKTVQEFLPSGVEKNWDFSPYVPPPNSKYGRTLHKRKRKHSDNCIEENCDFNQRVQLSRRDSFKGYGDYVDNSPSGARNNIEPKITKTKIKSARNSLQQHLEYSNDDYLDASVAANRKFVSHRRKHIFPKSSSAAEENVVSRSLPKLPAGLPPDIAAKIKAMQAAAPKLKVPPKSGPPRSGPVRMNSQRPAKPAGSGAGLPPHIKVIIGMDRKKPSGGGSRKFGNQVTGGMAPGVMAGKGKSHETKPVKPAEILKGISPGVPARISSGVSAGMPAGIQAEMPAGLSVGMPAGIPAGMPAGLSVGIPGMPAGMPVGMPAGMPAGMPVGMPGGVSAGAPAGIQAGMSAGLPPPAVVGVAGGTAPLGVLGLPPPPPLAAGLSASGRPVRPVPSPTADFSWLKQSLKAAVDRESVRVALQKEVAAGAALDKVVGAVRPQRAAAFSVQYTTSECSEIAAFKGAFPASAASACLVCQPGDRDGYSAGPPPAAAGMPSGMLSGMPPGISPGISSAVLPGIPAGIPPGTPSGVPPGASAGTPANVPREVALSVRRRRGGSLLGRLPYRRSPRSGAGRRRRQTAGRCAPICEIRDVRVRCTSGGAARALTVVGTALVSPARSFSQCSSRCQREWELLLQYAAAERLRAYFLSRQPIAAGAASSRPVPDSWQVEKVMRCSSTSLKLEHGLCYPQSNWVLRAVLAAQSSTAVMAGAVGAGAAALLLAIGLLCYFRVLRLPRWCGGGSSKRAQGGGGGGKLGEGGAGTVEFVEEPPPPPPP